MDQRESTQRPEDERGAPGPGPLRPPASEQLTQLGGSPSPDAEQPSPPASSRWSPPTSTDAPTTAAGRSTSKPAISGPASEGDERLPSNGTTASDESERPDARGNLPDPAAAASTQSPSPRQTRRWPFVVVIGLLLGALAWVGYAAYENRERATDWRQRSISLEEQVDGLRVLIGERTEALNERTRQANAVAASLRTTRRALKRSEGDVSSLSKRQRELASEKAQLQDERRMLEQQASALAGVASSYIDCKNSLIDVIDALVNEDYYSVSTYFDYASSDCSAASSALDSYLTQYE
jgi:hypothetical protein